MNDYYNKVQKVITEGNTTIFIIKTEGEEGFWWWQVDNHYINQFLNKHKIGSLTEQMANEFCNSEDYTDVGCSCGDYKTVEDILKDFWNAEEGE